MYKYLLIVYFSLKNGGGSRPHGGLEANCLIDPRAASAQPCGGMTDRPLWTVLSYLLFFYRFYYCTVVFINDDITLPVF
jgi:hypothetical protein